MAKKLLGLMAVLIFSLGALYFFQAGESPSFLNAPAPPTAASLTFRNVKIGYLVPDSTLADAMEAKHFYGQYMTELAKYLPWTYELVEVTPEQALYKLESGEIDLLLPMEKNPTREEEISYSQHKFFLDAIALYTRQHEKHFNPRDLSNLDGASVGLYKDRPANEHFFRFCQENNVNLQIRYYDDQKSIMVALRKGDIDLVVDTITNITSEEKLLLAFDIVDTHIGCLARNKSLLDDLDSADKKLLRDNPEYIADLKLALHSALRPQITNYTPAESTYIRTSRPLRVAFFNEAAPYVEYDITSKNARGILPDIFRLISSHSGFSFEFMHFTSHEDARRALLIGDADLMIDNYSAHMKDYEDYYYTSPIMQQDFNFISRTADEDSLTFKTEHHTLALVKDNSPEGLTYLLHEFPYWTFHQYSSPRDCLEAVKNKEADYALLDSYALMADRTLLVDPSLSPIYTTGTSVPICLTISKKQPPLLKDILNKTLLKISKDDLKQVIGKHRLSEKPELSLSYAASHYPMQTGLAVGLFLLMLSTIIFFVHHTRQEKKQREILTQTNAELEGTLQELWEAQKARDEYKEQAETDTLTGVLNKAAIEAFAKKAISRITFGKKVTDAFIIVDLDHFKEANDTRGHQYGDDILRDFAHALIRLTRHRDGVGRFGGDEFCLYLKNIPPDALPDFALRLMAAAHNLDPTQRPPLSASIGIVIIDNPALTYDMVFQRADRSLYEVKENGRDGFRIYGKPDSNPMRKPAPREE